MDDAVTFHQTEKKNINLYIKFMNKWKDFAETCLNRKKQLRHYVAYIANSKVLNAFQKWKDVNRCFGVMSNATKRLLKNKLFTGFNTWKRNHIKVRKLDGTLRQIRKLHHRTCFHLLARWKAYCRLLVLQRMILRSVMLTGNKRNQCRTQESFIIWKTMLKEAHMLDHKACYLLSRRKDSTARGVLTAWHQECVRRQIYRKNREKVVYSISQTLPVVRDLYDVLFSADSAEESVAMSTLALERILPGYQAEVYVMVSNTMLRASVPLKRSVSGISSRFSSHLFDRETQHLGTSPMYMDIPSSPIYPPMRCNLPSPPPSSPSFQSHVLPPSNGQPTPSPWTTDRSPVKGNGSGGGSGGDLFHTPYEQRYQAHEDNSNAEIVSVIVGRGNIGVCAKTGSYRVNRYVTSSTQSPDKHKQQSEAQRGETRKSVDDDVVSIVVPLISSGCIVGVLQLTPLRSAGTGTGSGEEPRPDSPVAFRYPSTSAMTFSYPFPNPPPHQSSFGAYSLPHSTSQSISQSETQTHSPAFNSSRFFKTAVAPIPPPQFTELVNMCMDVHISDVSTIAQLCIVVGTLSDSLRMYINGSTKKADFMTAAVAEKEQLESYIAQLHGEVATFEESIDKSSKRIEHLEKSRLKYFNESKSFRDKADAADKYNEALTQELGMCRDKLDKYESKKVSEDVVMQKLHRSLTKASIEVFGTPAATSSSHSGGHNDPGVDGSGGDFLRLSTSGYEVNGASFTGTQSNRQGMLQSQQSTQSHHSARNSPPQVSGQDEHMMRVTTNTPSSRFGYAQPPATLNTQTTFDTSSQFSPNSHPSMGIGMGPAAPSRGFQHSPSPFR
jgi:hypothetical protein